MKTEDITVLKRSQLEHVARHRDALRTSPHLRWIFFEITGRCNLSCRHCGSRCSASGDDLTPDDIRTTLRSVQQIRPMVCLTGGEPLLHPGFFEIAATVRDSGFAWGMTTNATLIDGATAAKLRQTGMSTVSVSLDGTERSHDYLRRKKGSWQAAVNGLRCLQDAGFEPQVTTVVNSRNIDDLDPLYDLLRDMGITSWRPINVEPIGRACESGDLMLDPGRFARLLSFIRSKRFDSGCGMEVTFGCSHYLGTEYERMVRDSYFLCGAGILVAGIRSNGDICACLDIENRPELIQGNIRKDDFMDVWLNRFQVFRRDRTSGCSRCLGCPERIVCGGDSSHTWDYEKNEPLLCFRDFQSELT